MLLGFQLQAFTHALATLAHATHAPLRSSCAMDGPRTWPPDVGGSSLFSFHEQLDGLTILRRKMADDMSAEDEASLLEDSGDATQGSSVSAPGTPSVSFNPALTTAGPGTLANSGKGPMQKKNLTPAPLVDREGYAVAKSFADGNPLSLPAETFHSRFSPAFEGETAPLIKQMGGGAVGELAVETCQAALYEGEPSTSTDHALTWLKSLVDEKRTPTMHAQQNCFSKNWRHRCRQGLQPTHRRS